MGTVRPGPSVRAAAAPGWLDVGSSGTQGQRGFVFLFFVCLFLSQGMLDQLL